MGCCSSQPEGEQIDPEVAAQRRRLSVAPGKVGNVDKSQVIAKETVPLDEKMPDDLKDLSEVETKAKGHMKVGICSRKGYVPYNTKKVNQDRPVLKFAMKEDAGLCLFGAMDGHGEFGHLVSQFVKENLPPALEKTTLRDTPKKSLHEGVMAMCQDLKKISGINCAFSGTTCCISMLVDKKLYTGNIGDSRCVVARQKPNTKEFEAIALSNDHKPELPAEKARIEAAGGRVEPLPGAPDEDTGPHRVWLKNLDVPGLAMSRSVGDYVSQTVGVISDPEITEHDLLDNDVFAIWASDGVWEFLENEDACKIVWDILLAKGSYQAAANALVNASTQRWEVEEENVIDDITCVIIGFNEMA